MPLYFVALLVHAKKDDRMTNKMLIKYCNARPNCSDSLHTIPCLLSLSLHHALYWLALFPFFCSYYSWCPALMLSPAALACLMSCCSHCCPACPYALLSCLDALLVLQRSPQLLRLPAYYPLPAVFIIASRFILARSVSVLLLLLSLFSDAWIYFYILHNTA